MSTPPIIVCTRNQFEDHVTIMTKSCDFYATDSIFELHRSTSNFGTAYNEAVCIAFAKYRNHERFIIANDDIVLRPDTVQMLVEDADNLDSRGIVWGHIAARADRIAPTLQSIVRNPLDAPAQIFQERWIAPVCSMINRKTWIDFPPINWGSDVIQCHDMALACTSVFVSRAYVHHIGGITTGNEAEADRERSRRWCLQHRPELVNFI
jgi:hypothetical protein